MNSWAKAMDSLRNIAPMAAALKALFQKRSEKEEYESEASIYGILIENDRNYIKFWI